MKTTIQEFKSMLRKDYNEYINSIRHEDDYMGIWDYYSENAKSWEKEYGIQRNEDTGELEYTWRNENYTEDDDEDDEDFYDE